MTEHDIQCQVIRWFDLQYRNSTKCGRLMAIPNGGHRHISVAKKLKAEGVRAGVPDLFLPVENGLCNGLFIEMKSQKGKTTDAQDGWIAFLRMQGYSVSVCHSFEEAKAVIEDYLNA